MVTDDQQWYVQSGSRVQGPYSTVEVGRYLLLGRVRSTDRVSKDGELWEPVTQVPELIPEELLDLETDQGWTRYLDSHQALEERHNTATAVLQERRVLESDQQHHSIRQEWTKSPRKLHNKPVVPLLPMALLGVTLVALFVVIYLNSMTNVSV